VLDIFYDRKQDVPQVRHVLQSCSDTKTWGKLSLNMQITVSSVWSVSLESLDTYSFMYVVYTTLELYCINHFLSIEIDTFIADAVISSGPMRHIYTNFNVQQLQRQKHEQQTENYRNDFRIMSYKWVCLACWEQELQWELGECQRTPAFNFPWRKR